MQLPGFDPSDLPLSSGSAVSRPIVAIGFIAAGLIGLVLLADDAAGAQGKVVALPVLLLLGGLLGWMMTWGGGRTAAPPPRPELTLTLEDEDLVYDFGNDLLVRLGPHTLRAPGTLLSGPVELSVHDIDAVVEAHGALWASQGDRESLKIGEHGLDRERAEAAASVLDDQVHLRRRGDALDKAAMEQAIEAARPKD